MNELRPPPALLCCRPEFTAALREEWAATDPTARELGSGLVSGQRLPPTPLVFEHQRLPAARRVPSAQLKPISDAVWAAIMDPLVRARHRWTLHAWSLASAPQNRVEGIAETLLRMARKKAPELDDLFRPPHRAERMDDALVLQLCLADDGLWHAVAPMSTLSCRKPGGHVRMKDDPQAPSRSYLKVEEAFYRMNAWPLPGQRVVDLGAAPGGWTLAFAKRGCRVTAVDNGPLRLPAPGPDWGAVEHLQADGLTFQLDRNEPPADWLVADMLVPPGHVLGLLERWLARPAMLRFIVNMKLPEGAPLTALRPLLTLLARYPAFRGSVRHLYHDREEVTAWGHHEQLDASGAFS